MLLGISVFGTTRPPSSTGYQAQIEEDYKTQAKARLRKTERAKNPPTVPYPLALRAASAATHWQPRVWPQTLAWPPEWAPNRERHMTLTSPSGSCQSH